MKNLNVKVKAKNLLEENEVNLHNLEFGNGFLDRYDTKNVNNKRKIDKLVIIKSKDNPHTGKYLLVVYLIRDPMWFFNTK